MWKCAMCKRMIDLDMNKVGMKCPYCDGKVFFKERPTTTKRLKTN